MDDAALLPAHENLLVHEDVERGCREEFVGYGIRDSGFAARRVPAAALRQFGWVAFGVHSAEGWETGPIRGVRGCSCRWEGDRGRMGGLGCGVLRSRLVEAGGCRAALTSDCFFIALQG